jgi:hypothetical protein
MSYHETSIHCSSIQSSPNLIGVRDAKKIENEGRMSFEKIFRKTKLRFFCLVCCWLIVLSFLSADDGGLAHRKKLED